MSICIPNFLSSPWQGLCQNCLELRAFPLFITCFVHGFLVADRSERVTECIQASDVGQSKEQLVVPCCTRDGIKQAEGDVGYIEMHFSTQQ